LFVLFCFWGVIHSDNTKIVGKKNFIKLILLMTTFAQTIRLLSFLCLFYTLFETRLVFTTFDEYPSVLN